MRMKVQDRFMEARFVEIHRVFAKKKFGYFSNRAVYNELQNFAQFGKYFSATSDKIGKEVVHKNSGKLNYMKFVYLKHKFFSLHRKPKQYRIQEY